MLSFTKTGKSTKQVGSQPHRLNTEQTKAIKRLENEFGAKVEKKVNPILTGKTEKVEADPKPKLFRIDWTDKSGQSNHRYVAAIDKVIAATLFDKKYGKDTTIAEGRLSINRVPSEWHTRFPVMWDRIGIAIQDTHKEEIAARKAEEKQLLQRVKEWRKSWVELWDGIGKNSSNDYTLWIELQKVKYSEWFNGWIEMWSDLGETRMANSSRFSYIESD